MKKSILYLSFIFIFIGCGPNIIFEKKTEIADGVWLKDQKLSYVFDIKDTVQRYDILMNINSDKSYRYQNVYIKIETVFPKGNKTEDLVSLEIAKPNGEPFGKCSGDECTTPILLQEKVKFPSIGNYKINMQQYSRMDAVEGINYGKLTIQEVE